jgi:lactoylglutathione lyase
MDNLEQTVPLLNVHDIQASVRFYTEGLGFVMTHDWEQEGKLRWCMLRRDGVAVMLQQFWHEGQHRNVPHVKVGVGVTFCFFCKDAVALWREFVSRKVAAKRPFVGNGLWVTELSDPDGYELCFESPTDAADDTVLPEE